MNQAKAFIGTALIFLISMFQSCSEVRLSLFGVKSEATVEAVMVEYNTKTKEETGKYLVRYKFNAKDSEGMREVKDQYVCSREEAENTSEGDKLPLKYIDGRPTVNRVSGHGKTVWVITFLIFLVIFIGHGYFVYKEAMDDVKRSKRR